MSDRPNRAPEIKRSLTDVTRVLELLGVLGEGRARRRQGGGWLIRCPVHEERTPSCSVRLGEGVLLWKCHACDATGDVLSLIAAVRGMSMSGPGFRDVLCEAARMAGLWALVDELEGRGAAPPPPPAPPPAPVQERDYPPEDEVRALWDACVGATCDAQVAEYLAGRAIDPALVESSDLARTMPERGALPRWASCRGGTWREMGYHIVVPMFAPDGTMRSVRAWRSISDDTDAPKRLPPYGHKASGLVMTDMFSLAMLRGQRQPERVVVTEGEPDTLTWATRVNDPRTAVLGIVSGSWTDALTQRFPVGTVVIVRTDHDEAGERYARLIVQALKRRCFVRRGGEDD